MPVPVHGGVRGRGGDGDVHTLMIDLVERGRAVATDLLDKRSIRSAMIGVVAGVCDEEQLDLQRQRGGVGACVRTASAKRRQTGRSAIATVLCGGETEQGFAAGLGFIA